MQTARRESHCTARRQTSVRPRPGSCRLELRAIAGYDAPMTLRMSAALTFVLLAFGSTAQADSFKAPPVHTGGPVSIQAYGKQNPACRSWTDGCVLCATDPDGKSQCSTPGIACQPHGLTCKALAPK